MSSAASSCRSLHWNRDALSGDTSTYYSWRVMPIPVINYQVPLRLGEIRIEFNASGEITIRKLPPVRKRVALLCIGSPLLIFCVVAAVFQGVQILRWRTLPLAPMVLFTIFAWFISIVGLAIFRTIRAWHEPEYLEFNTERLRFNWPRATEIQWREVLKIQIEHAGGNIYLLLRGSRTQARRAEHPRMRVLTDVASDRLREICDLLARATNKPLESIVRRNPWVTR
jgi:hypothetical protein